MDIKFVRKNGLNINNNDDYVPFKYAYGNIDGYTGGFPYSINGNVLHIGTARIIIQGVESVIETGGIDIEFDIVNEKRRNLVYLSVNMATQTSSILTKYDTGNYNLYQDLIYQDITGAYGQGVAQIPLIYLETENGVISNVRKDVEQIPFTEDIKVKNAEFSDKAQFSNVAETLDNDNRSERIATTNFVHNVNDNTINQINVIKDVLDIKTQTLTANYMNITLYKMAGLVFGYITGEVRSRGKDSEPVFYGIAKDTFNFQFDEDFKPESNVVIFQGGNGSFDGTTPSQMLTEGYTDSGNRFWVYVSEGGTLDTTGKLSFVTKGGRDSSSTALMRHPITYSFVYKAGV